MVGLFERLEGAALFRTDRGDFEVLFLPRPLRFDDLRVTERREARSYVYSFEGQPRPWPANHMENARRTYFLGHAGWLFVVMDDRLATQLRMAFRARDLRVDRDR
jgi:hypothetical protein